MKQKSTKLREGDEVIVISGKDKEREEIFQELLAKDVLWTTWILLKDIQSLTHN